jgi:hypothetical protein
MPTETPWKFVNKRSTEIRLLKNWKNSCYSDLFAEIFWVNFVRKPPSSLKHSSCYEKTNFENGVRDICYLSTYIAKPRYHL